MNRKELNERTVGVGRQKEFSYLSKNKAKKFHFTWCLPPFMGDRNI